MNLAAAIALYASSPDSQSDNAAFTGKKYRVQDISYGHYVGEFDTSEEANHAAQARPYSRVLKHTEWSQTQKSRDMARRKLARKSKLNGVDNKKQ
jgi:hypothetical protein